MSLQVWLPLNGNLNNQGLSEVTVTNSGATVDSNGKIGSCYSFNTGKYLAVTRPVAITKEISYSCWVKISSWNSATFDCIMTIDTGTAWKDCRATLCRNGSSTNLTWNIANGSSSSRINSNTSLSLNTWYHIACTYNGTKLRIYVNGVEDNSLDTSLIPNYDSAKLYIGSSNGNIHYLNGFLNDVRIYNHCLSAKEVKEISKGLVCHYKLDNNGLGNPNLITTMTPGGRTALNGKYGLNADFSQNTDTWGYFNVSPALELNSTYTLSFDVSNFPVGGAWNFCLWNNANYDVGSITKDGHYTYTFVPSESKLPSGYNLTKFLFDDGARTNPAGIVHFTNFKIEKGNKATSWCPHTSDSLYTSLGLDSTTELDCSGLSNNGTKIGGLSSSTNPLSIRYESCYNFDGNTGSIQIPNLSTLVPSGEFTMNCWIYHDNTWSSKGYETIFGGPSGFELEAKNTSTNAPVLHAWSWGKGQATYELNKWNMITMTRNASETKFYINGELKITGSAGTIPSGNYFIGAWNTSSQQNFKGKISDFRLYSTVLSTEDIKTLYNTSASVDKNGNMYAYEFKEE